MGPTLDYGLFLFLAAVSAASGCAAAMLHNVGFGFWSYPLGILIGALAVLAVASIIEFWRRRRLP